MFLKSYACNPCMSDWMNKRDICERWGKVWEFLKRKLLLCWKALWKHMTGWWAAQYHCFSHNVHRIPSISSINRILRNSGMLLPSDTAAADGGGGNATTSIPPYVHATNSNNSYEPGSLGRRGTTVGHNVGTNSNSTNHNNKAQAGQYYSIILYYSWRSYASVCTAASSISSAFNITLAISTRLILES